MSMLVKLCVNVLSSNVSLDESICVTFTKSQLLALAISVAAAIMGGEMSVASSLDGWG